MSKIKLDFMDPKSGNYTVAALKNITKVGINYIVITITNTLQYQ